MHSITLICTAHKDWGQCNSTELYKIIEEIKPQIIFEELSPSTYQDCYCYNSWGFTKIKTLETAAIKNYLENHQIKHIPVLDSQLHDDFDLMQREVQDYNYRYLVEKLMALKWEYGFKYLNSEDCEGIFADIRTLQKTILNENEKFSRAYEDVDRYENEIIKNVYKYSAEYSYSKALMFIGAAHRKSIIKKIKEQEKVSKLKIVWSFDYFQA